ncbi:MAG: hypothetical protein DRP54_00865 [Spirochaetes bacterium]|nr:MAG: hypothetical protein DRP54_00865 [Spirochaetota bacterium]
MLKYFREGDGFCNNHAWDLKEMGDALGQSILYEDLLKTMLSKIRNTINGGSFKSKYRHAKKCIICRFKQRTED